MEREKKKEGGVRDTGISILFFFFFLHRLLFTYFILLIHDDDDDDIILNLNQSNITNPCNYYL